MIETKRAYEPPSRQDGYRVLVERLWPRGIKKEALALDAWEKDLAPSNELRKWFSHDPARWKEFRRRYRAELRMQPRTLRQLAERAANAKVTLIFSSHDAEHNNAVALRAELQRRATRPSISGSAGKPSGGTNRRRGSSRISSKRRAPLQ
jgi:uncharacterized protein YeaO (DUF488 family)